MLQISNSLQQLKDSHRQLTASVNRVEEGQQTLQSEFGELLERQLRGDIQDQHGGQYAKGLLARSIIDFVHLFKDRAIQPKLNDFQDRASLLLPAVQVCCLFCSLHCTESTGKVCSMFCSLH